MSTIQRYTAIPTTHGAIMEPSNDGIWVSREDHLAEVERLRAALEAAKHFLGPHFIRSVGKCEKCGGHTPNGTLKLCRSCFDKIVDQALTPTSNEDE